MNCDSIIDSYCHYMLKHGRKQSTINRSRYDLLAFLIWLQSKQTVTRGVLKELTSNDIQMYLESLSSKPKYSTSYLKQKYIYIKNFLEFYGAKIEINKLPSSKLKTSNFATDQDIQRLLSIMQSYEGLSDYQAAGRIHIMNRNILLVHFMLHYGLSMSDITTLSMKNVNLGTHTITPGKAPREIQLTKNDQKLLLAYYKDIPEISRPRQHSNDSLFVAFDFARLTFRWNYETNEPKPLTERSIQDMLKKESKRANIYITPTTLRNRFILNALQAEINPEEIRLILGLKSSRALYPYIDFYNELKSKKQV